MSPATMPVDDSLGPDDAQRAMQRLPDGHRWVAAGAASDVPAREGRVTVIDGRVLAIFNLGDRFAAVDDRCPHRGGPLSDGIVAGAHVVCPLHAWKVNLATGLVDRPCETGAQVRTYSIRIERGVVYVAVPTSIDTSEAHPS